MQIAGLSETQADSQCPRTGRRHLILILRVMLPRLKPGPRVVSGQCADDTFAICHPQICLDFYSDIIDSVC